MKIKILGGDDYRTSVWSGGTTTQLYIYPEGGDYAARRFSVRISSATVDDEESDFTPLPGVTRYITPIKGGFTLTHPGETPVVMAPCDAPYRFDGGIPTHSAGRAADMNLMLKGVDGLMEMAYDRQELRPGLNALWPVGGGVIRVGNEKYRLEAGQLIVVELAEGESAAAVCPRSIYFFAGISF